VTYAIRTSAVRRGSG